MENNEVMNVETEEIEAVETAEETGSGYGALAVVCVGSMVVGGLAYKLLIQPTTNKVKAWWMKRKSAKVAEDEVEADYEEVDESDEDSDEEE